MDKELVNILQAIVKAGFEVAIVGGAVRDFLAKKDISDWDFTTNASPEEILKLIKGSFYNNRFGTVGVVLQSQKLTIQITTYRTEEKYTDKRHPDVIVWGKTLEEDLSRRDFTINAMALRIKNGKLKVEKDNLVDPFDGQKDLRNKLVRAVGDPDKRF